VKLIDFGVAKWGAQQTETRHGVLKGKCAYMSPEQCRAEALDRRSDVFSLGVLLYEITAGTRPFSGDNDFEVMTAIVRGAVEAPSARWPGYPLGLEPIVLRALSPRREDRFATTQELARALSDFAAGKGIVPSASGLAALLASTFGDEAGGAVGAEESGAHQVSSTADTSPARGSAAALDRTATDHQAPAATIPALSLAEPASEALRALSARRIAIIAGVGLACVAAVAVAAPWFRRAPAAAVRAPAAPVVLPAAPPQSAPTTTTATATPNPVAATPGGKKRVKRAAAPVPPAAERVKVWDPDSPQPPP